MNGAGAGGRFVGRRVRGTQNTMRREDIGRRSQLGNREQKRYDLRVAFGASI